MATAETAFGGGLNSSSGGELKLYLKWKRNTIGQYYLVPPIHYLKDHSYVSYNYPVLSNNTPTY